MRLLSSEWHLATQTLCLVHPLTTPSVLFGVACAFTYTPLQAVVPVEALSTSMRAKGLAVCNFLMQGTFSAYSLPY